MNCNARRDGFKKLHPLDVIHGTLVADYFDVLIQRLPDFARRAPHAKAPTHRPSLATPIIIMLLGGPVAAQFSQSETTANAGVRLTIPIFQGGLTAARQRQASARETASLEQVIAAERSVIQQTRAAYASWQASVENIVSGGAISRSTLRNFLCRASV